MKTASLWELAMRPFERSSILVRDFLYQLQERIINFWQKHICFELRHGTNIPPFYGLAGFNKVTERMWVLPIGVNYLYGLLNWFYHDIAEGLFSRAESYTYKTGRQIGQLAGEQRGYRIGYLDAKNGEPDKVMQALRINGAKALPYVLEDGTEEEIDANPDN